MTAHTIPTQRSPSWVLTIAIGSRHAPHHRNTYLKPAYIPRRQPLSWNLLLKHTAKAPLAAIPPCMSNKAPSTSGLAASSLCNDMRIRPFEPRRRCQPSPPLRAAPRPKPFRVTPGGLPRRGRPCLAVWDRGSVLTSSGSLFAHPTSQPNPPVLTSPS